MCDAELTTATDEPAPAPAAEPSGYTPGDPHPSSWRKLAKRRWPHSEISGDGRHALVALCSRGGFGVAVQLFSTRWGVKAAHEKLTAKGCGSLTCHQHHVVVDLREAT